MLLNTRLFGLDIGIQQRVYFGDLLSEVAVLVNLSLLPIVELFLSLIFQ